MYNCLYVYQNKCNSLRKLTTRWSITYYCSRVTFNLLWQLKVTLVLDFSIMDWAYAGVCIEFSSCGN